MSEPMDCTLYAEEYSALIDGELAPAREALARAHLDRCEPCRAQIARLRRVDGALANLSLPSFPEDLRARLQARIERPALPVLRAPRRRRRWLAPSAAAAGLAAAASAVFYLATGPSEPASEDAPLVVARATPDLPDPAASTGLLTPAPGPGADGIDLELESPEDLDVIVNLELLEAFVALEGGTG
jgi:hypothetical protein